MEDLGGGIWRWTPTGRARHAGGFGSRSRSSYALAGAGRTVLVDPLAPSDAELLERLDCIVTGRVVIVVTIPYHVRGSEALSARYGGAPIWGHRNAATRMADRSAFRELSPASVPEGVRAFAIGQPRRTELPVLVESHRALAFGDAIVETGEGLRMWAGGPVDDRSRRWHAERLVPTVEPILAADFEHLLMTHGAPVIGGGRAALADALRRPPWYHRG